MCETYVHMTVSAFQYIAVQMEVEMHPWHHSIGWHGMTGQIMSRYYSD